MAEDNTNLDSQGQEDASLKSKQEPITEEQWSKIVGGKFKTKEDLANAYLDLEREKGRLADDYGKAKEFAEIVKPLLEVVRDDPKLFAEIDAKLRGETEDKKEDTKGKESGDLREVTSGIIVNRFEDKYGINKLEPARQKELKERIGVEVYELTGQTVENLDLRRLEKVLDKAYVLATKDQLVNNAKLEALAEARGLEGAGIPNIPSQSGKTEKTLTPEERRVAQKMGLTEEQYLAGKK